MGWTYWELMALPSAVYIVLVDQLRTELERANARDVA